MPAASDARYWLALDRIPGIGPETFRRLLKHFGLPEQVYAAPHSELLKLVDSKLAAAISAGLDESALAPTLSWLENPAHHLLTLADAAYPQSLLQIADPPPLLFVKGNIALLQNPAFAIVGSRQATPQGEKDATAFAQALSDAGFTIVSGMALGVDAAAHRGGLAGSASSIAVVGTGLDIVYPARNRELAHRLAEQGALVSEFPLGTPSKAANFPRRNRIISGLVRGVLVVEAAPQSGSLITARLAGEQGREVFAIPGSIHSPLARGCHRLIKQGAKLVESAQDILEELGERAAPASAHSSEDAYTGSQEEEGLVKHLGYSACSIDGLVRRTGLTAERVCAILLQLELSGRVSALPGGLYQVIE